MKKTSVYLDEEHQRRLREIAEREGRSQSEVLREAIAHYSAFLNAAPDRTFVSAGSYEGDGEPMTQEEIDELMKGFGSDAYSGRWADLDAGRQEGSEAADRPGGAS